MTEGRAMRSLGDGVRARARADSSARREHLFYKQGVTGSNPVPPMAWLLVAAALAGCAGGGAKPGASGEPAVTAAPAFPAPAGVPVVVVRTERGTFKFALLEKYAPITVRNFVGLAEKGFYTNLAFHRVEPGILIQGGDPQGNGTGGPGYSIKAEFNEHPHR